MRSPSRESSLPFCAMTAKFFKRHGRSRPHLGTGVVLKQLDERTDHRPVLRLPQALRRHLPYRVVIVRQARLEHRVEIELDVVVRQLDELPNDLAPAFGRQLGPDDLELGQALDRQVGKLKEARNTSRAFPRRSGRLGGRAASRWCPNECPAGWLPKLDLRRIFDGLLECSESGLRPTRALVEVRPQVQHEVA